MVSAAQRLRQQQSQLRRPGARIPLRLQQESLRRGISAERIIQEREIKRVEREITQSQKEQALIAEGVLRQAGNVQQLEQLLKTVPQEVRRFITVTPDKAKQDIAKNISQLENRITNQETLLRNLRENRKKAQKAGNQQRASDIEATISGVEKEVGFLKGTLPQLEKGSLVSFSEIRSVGQDVRSGEEFRRIELEKQFAPLAAKLEGGRRELSMIFRERRITAPQQIALGLISQVQVSKLTKVPDVIIQEFIQDEVNRFKAGTISTSSFKQGIASLGKQGGLSIKEQNRIISDAQKGGIDIFQFSPQLTDVEKLLESDFSRLTETTKEKGFVGKIKDIAPKIIDLKEPIFGVRPEAKSAFEAIGKVVAFPREIIVESLTEEERKIAKVGVFIPTDISQIEFPKMETLKFEPKFLTEKEIKGQLFGGGLDILQQRRVRQAEFKLEQLGREEFRKFNEVSNVKINKKFNELQKKVVNKKLTAEESNNQLIDFTDKINKENNKKLKELIDKESDKLSKEINKEITDADKKNFIKRELALFGLTVATGAVLGFGAAVSPIIAGGLAVFGAIETGKIVVPTFEAIKTKDIQVLGATAIQITGFAIGGGIGAKFGGKFIQNTKIRPAIERSQVETIVKSKNLDILKQFKFPKEFELEIKTLIDKGFSVRVIETKLRASRIADSKFLPDVRGRFIEILTRDGRIIETISIGEVLASTPKKTFSRQIISESIGKVTGEKSLISTRSIIGKLKGDKFKPLQEFVTVQETQLTGREKLTPFEQQIRSETTTFLVEKLTKKQLKKQKVFKPDDFGDILGTNKDLIGGKILEGGRIPKSQLDIFLKEQKRVGKRISETETTGIDKITGIELIKDIQVKTQDFGVIKIKKNLGEILSGTKISESKSQSFTVNVPEIKIKPRPKVKSTNTIQEVFGKAEKQPKFEFKDIFKRKDKGKQDILTLDIKTQQKQINKNLNKLTQPSEFITKQVAKDIIKADTRKALIFGRIPSLDVGEKFGDLGVISSRLGATTVAGIEEEAKLKKREKVKQPDITKAIENLGQIPRGISILKQPQAQLSLQLQKLNTNLSGFGVSPPVITNIVIPKIPVPILFDFPEKDKKRRIIRAKLDMGWNVFAKSKGKKKKVNENPIGLDNALDLGSWVVDNSLSAEFSLQKTRKQAKKPNIIVPNNYWKTNQNKFRNFRKKQGKIIPLKNIFIEKQNRRLDTRGEINRITTDRLLSQKRTQDKEMQRINKNLGNIFGFPQAKPRKKATRKKRK